MSLRMRGVAGELRRGYQVAADLGPWTMDESGRVEATPITVDAYWIENAAGGLALWLRVGKKAWVWRDVVMETAGPPIVVRVAGSPTIRD